MKALIAALVLSLALVAPVASAGGQRTIVVPEMRDGDTFSVSGCGYTKPEVILYLYRESDDAELFGGAVPAPGGCFAFRSGITLAGPADYEVAAYQIKGSAGPGSYNQNHPSAYLDFTVAP